jgi:hypothetical protein
VGVDLTTLEANAAMKSIVRRDTGEDWRKFVTRLMQEEGAVAADEKPSDEELRRFDKKRKKKVSNDEWVSKTDADARITKMKDGRTHLAYKAEHVVEAILAAGRGRRDQALPTVCRCAQSGPDHAFVVRNRQAEGTAKPGRACLACAAHRLDVMARCKGQRAPAKRGRSPIRRAGRALRALRWPDAFPLSDLGLNKALRSKFAKSWKRASERWRPWRAYATMHFGKVLPDLPNESH